MTPIFVAIPVKTEEEEGEKILGSFAPFMFLLERRLRRCPPSLAMIKMTTPPSLSDLCEMLARNFLCGFIADFRLRFPPKRKKKELKSRGAIQ